MLIYGSCIVKDNFKEEANSTSTKVSIDPKSSGKLKDVDSVNMIYSGNSVLYTLSHINEGCFGLVLATGYATKKGKAIRKKLIKKNFN